MWRLKIAEGGNSPYLYSTNDFVGRQIWEFDADAGTPEEREEVENARLQFWNNRHQVKPSSDLLWRMQVSHLSNPFCINMFSSLIGFLNLKIYKNQHKFSLLYNFLTTRLFFPFLPRFVFNQLKFGPLDFFCEFHTHVAPREKKIPIETDHFCKQQRKLN